MQTNQEAHQWCHRGALISSYQKGLGTTPTAVAGSSGEASFEGGANGVCEGLGIGGLFSDSAWRRMMTDLGGVDRVGPTPSGM